MSDHPDDAPAAPARGEILPPIAQSLPDVNAARALVGRLVRGGDVSPELLTLVDGPLADAVAKAAEYAGKSIAPGTIATYKGDWSDFLDRLSTATDPSLQPGRQVGEAGQINRGCLGHGVQIDGRRQASGHGALQLLGNRPGHDQVHQAEAPRSVDVWALTDIVGLIDVRPVR
jgi:hypothetical protein